MENKMLLTFIFLGIFKYFALSQDSSMYEKHVFLRDGDSLPYRLLLPVGYDANKKFPFIVVLHGSGERGNDNVSQLVHGGDVFLADSIRRNYPAIVVFPQCATNGFWSNIIVHTDTANK